MVLMDAALTLVTVLGTKPRTLEYRLSGRTHQARSAGAALSQLLSPAPSRVIAACTSEAETESLPILRAELSGVSPELLRVPRISDREEACQVIEALASPFDDAETVIVDITNGPRDLAVLAFAAAALASAMGRVSVGGVYYAWVAEGAADFVDLGSLLTVLDLSHAARSFAETGSAEALAHVLSNVAGQSKAANALVRALCAFSTARLAGLPLEQGKRATELLARERSFRLELRRSGVPLADRIAKMVSGSVDSVRLDVSGDNWKRSVRLDWRELERQRHPVDERIRVGAWSTALLMMEEWVISWAIWRRGEGADWLHEAAREQARNSLHALRKIGDDDPARLTPEQERLGDFWNQLTSARNAFAHAGMRYQEVDPSSGQLRGSLDTIREVWRWLGENPDVSLTFGGSRPLMVSPLGRLPGALFTAISKKPGIDTCLVVCSAVSRPSLDGIAARVSRPPTFVPLLLEDPLAGAREVQRIVQEATPHLLDASEVHVHLTGGSTLMGYACERIADQARRYGRPVRYFLTLDRRDRAEQEREPFVEGELVDLPDGWEGNP
jgi:hypothetical protein